MRNEVSAQLFGSGRNLGECFYILNYLVFFVFVLNWRDLLKRDRELHLLKRDRELEGPTNVSQKQDVLKRDLI